MFLPSGLDGQSPDYLQEAIQRLKRGLPNLLRPKHLFVLVVLDSLLDAVVWWPRLATLLPEDFRVQVDSALTPMLTVINLSMICTFFALFSGIMLFFVHQWLSWGLCFLIGGLFLGRVLYVTATHQADVYGRLIRVAFDLYRQEILTKMHVPVPTNLISERILWDQLTKWHYFYTESWEFSDEPPEPEIPFYCYDTYQTSADTAAQPEIILMIKGGSGFTKENEDKNNKKNSQRASRRSGPSRQ